MGHAARAGVPCGYYREPPRKVKQASATSLTPCPRQGSRYGAHGAGAVACAAGGDYNAAYRPGAAADGGLWPADLDALVAAPAHHTLLFENERVRVLDTHIAPGDRTPIHTHQWPGVLYILSWTTFVRYDAHGAVLLDSRTVPALHAPPPVLWSAPLPPHALENIGATELHLIAVEWKESPGGSA